MEFKYFIGCESLDQVKERYKALSKIYHPDSTYSNATPNTTTFISLKAEYDFIIEDDVDYPISNTIILYPMTPSESFQKETVTNLNPQEIEYNRIKTYFDKLKLSDGIYEVIDGLLEEKNKQRYWYLSEIQKVDNLTKDHFKYITWKLKMSISIAHSAYDNYIKQRVL